MLHNNAVSLNVLFSSISGGLDKLTGSSETKDTTKVAAEEDPEVIQAKLEAEEQRKEKHRRMEDEREKLRNNIRDKVSLMTVINGITSVYLYRPFPSWIAVWTAEGCGRGINGQPVRFD